MKQLFFPALAIIVLAVFSSTAGAQAVPRLFSISDRVLAPDDKTSVASVREAEIDLASSNFAADSAASIDIPLLDGKLYRAERSFLEIRGIDDHSWFGVIRDGRFRGDVILTFGKGHLSGLIYAGKAVYEIVPRGRSHVLVELDQSRFPECGGSPKPEQDVLPPSDSLGAGPDSGDRIDVLVVYTTATKNFLGGDTQAHTFAQQAIAASNAAYTNTRIRQRVRLVHTAEYAFVETGNSSSDLSALRANTAVQELRDTHSADLVAMIGEVTDVCGIGYLVGGPTSAASGYSITARSCAVGNLTFAHEMGHNMGSHHNPENAGSTPQYPFSYGHYVSGQFRTVMSYTNPCSGGCPRRPYFSSPLIFHDGIPTGIDGERDNRRSLDLTGDVVANYRYSGSSVRLTNFRSAGMIPRGIRREVTWTADNIAGSVRIDLSRDEGATWETLAADTPNDGAEPVTIWGRPTKRARLRVVSLSDAAVSDSSTAGIYIR